MLDTWSKLCPAEICSTNRGSFWVYRDGLHLSRGMSLDLAPLFRPVVDGP